MQARFVLRWLDGEIDALPLWSGGPQELHVTDGAEYPHTRADIDEVYSWALLGEIRYPRRAGVDRAGGRMGFGWVRGGGRPTFLGVWGGQRGAVVRAAHRWAAYAL